MFTSIPRRSDDEKIFSKKDYRKTTNASPTITPETLATRTAD